MPATGTQNGFARTRDAVERQLRAMNSGLYEVGLFRPATDGKQAEMLPRTWDQRTLLDSLSWLRWQNSQGRNIYVRPAGEHHLSLVDDLTADSVLRMKKDGFAPSVVVETSPGNLQAWLNHGEVLPKDLSTAAARALAQQFGGDKGAADWRHFGRLSGFTNRKSKYQGPNGLYPFVHLIEAQGMVYPEAGASSGRFDVNWRGRRRSERAFANTCALPLARRRRARDSRLTTSATTQNTTETETGSTWLTQSTRSLTTSLKTISELRSPVGISQRRVPRSASKTTSAELWRRRGPSAAFPHSSPAIPDLVSERCRGWSVEENGGGARTYGGFDDLGPE
jgi:hypothetical protein